MSEDDFRDTVRLIESDRKYRPFDKSLPWTRIIMLKLFSLLVLLSYAYICFFIL